MARMVDWLNALGRTRRAIMAGITGRMLRRQTQREEAIEAWEEALVRADVPVRVAMELVEQLRRDAGRDAASARDELVRALCEALSDRIPFSWASQHRPRVLLLVGVNGSGKTTTAAKLARIAKCNGLNPVLAAADTFRAAGSDQLAIWAERVQCEVVTGPAGADPAAVAFDGLRRAIESEADLLLVDTAGRMHTKQPLMQELAKIHRALGKCMPGAPHESWIVLDAAVGANAVRQAKTFNEAIPLNGVVVAKLDGSAKAGFLLGIDSELALPVHFVGVGEGPDDLVPFDAESFVRAMLADGDSDAETATTNQ